MYSVKDLQEIEEYQIFDRKSIRIDAKALAIPIVAFANADGGILAIGIDDKTREIEGIDSYMKHVNELLTVPFDYCIPSVNVTTELVDCIDKYGNKNHILIINVKQSNRIHANQADEVYYRVGDKSKKLSFAERTQLMYDKGDMFYEDSPIRNADITDIDMDFLEDYLIKIGYSKKAMDYLLENKDFVRQENNKYIISAAAILLFGKHPQTYFPRARIRFIKYDGTEEKTGASMNVVKDVIWGGNILSMLQKSTEYLSSQIKEHTYLDEDGQFITKEEYPKFVRQELIVNAVAHRDYSIKGTDIQIKMFDDRLVIESPGALPGLVRINNMRNVHFSRNPKTAEFLRDYKYVKEFGEGIDRIFLEMEDAGLPEPKYQSIEFMLKCTLKNNLGAKKPIKADKKPIKADKNTTLTKNEQIILEYLNENKYINNKTAREMLGLAESTTKRLLGKMAKNNLILAEGNRKERKYKKI